MGEARIKIDVMGLDGTRVSDVETMQVLGPAPQLRLIDQPRDGVVGRPVRVRFEVSNGVGAVVEVSTRSGIVFTRRYEIRGGLGLATWTPDAPGEAELVVRLRGTQGQTTKKTLVIDVAPRTAVTPPSVAIISAPALITAGEESTFVFRVDGCLSARAWVTGPRNEVNREWRFTCPADPARVTWTPATPGEFVLTVMARGETSTSQTSVPLTVQGDE